MTDDRYHRNPARDIEAHAVELVRTWVSDQGVVENTADGPGPDFQILYNDGRVGLGEVAWHEDPEIQAMWAATFRRERHQVIPLAAGSGQWGVGLTRGARIDRLYERVGALVGDLVVAGIERLEVVDEWPRTPIGDEARRLGISYMHRVNVDEPAIAVFFMPGSGGQVPPDAEVIVDWADQLLRDDAYTDTTRKLLRLECDERHVFVMSGSLTDFGPDERLRRLDEALPTRRPVLPDGITHLWLIARYGSSGAALWSPDGWCLVPASDDGEATAAS